MAWCLCLIVVSSVAASSPAEAESAKQLDSIVQAQVDIGRILRGFGRGGSVDRRRDPHQHDEGHSESEGRWRPTPTHPTHKHPPHRPWPGYKPRPHYFPRPQYIPRPQYTPIPEYTPSPTIITVPSNVLPAQTQTTVEPEANVVLVDPQPNNFLDALGIKSITPRQLHAFGKQLAKKNKQLGEDLKKLFPGNDKLIDRLLASADSGQLNVQAVQELISALGGNPSLQVQLQATGFIKQLVFNNLAMSALLNVNINLLNINIVNINIVNINVSGGAWGGFWGFPHWPWSHPIWLGPGVWWGPCGCATPYYNPNLNGAAVLGVPYSLANPAPGYPGNLVTSGILLTNVGGAKVNYTIGGKRYSMSPNYRQVIARGRIVVSFDRGGSLGRAKYGIDEGWYEFTPTDKGWELYEKTAKITLDNTGNPFSFNYLLNNRRRTLEPGYRQEHSGKYPLQLKFSNGKGQTIKKILGQGDFKVAVDANGGLALFKPEDVTRPPPIAQMSRKAAKKTENIFARPETIPNLFGDTTSGAAASVPSGSAQPAPPSLFGPKN